MPSLEDELLRRIPEGMGAVNRGYQPSPMEDFVMNKALGRLPDMQQGEMAMGPLKGMLSMAQLLQAAKGSGAKNLAGDVFARGLKNQSTRGSMLSSAQLRALADDLFTKSVK